MKINNSESLYINLHNKFSSVDIKKNTEMLKNGMVDKDIAAIYNMTEIVNKRFYDFESQYDYAEQFDDISRDYRDSIWNKDYSAASSSNVIEDMESKYQQLKSDIEDNYTGKDKEDRLSGIDIAYEYVLNVNVIDPTYQEIGFEKLINKMRMNFEAMRMSSAEKKGETYTGNYDAYKQIGDQLNSFLDIFKQFKEAAKDSHGKDKSEFVNSLLKSIGAGMTVVQEKNKQLREKKSGKNIEVNEVSELIEEKTDIYAKMNKKYNTNEEKYKSYAEYKEKLDAIDKRIEELVNNL